MKIPKKGTYRRIHIPRSPRPSSDGWTAALCGWVVPDPHITTEVSAATCGCCKRVWKSRFGQAAGLLQRNAKKQIIISRHRGALKTHASAVTLRRNKT